MEQTVTNPSKMISTLLALKARKRDQVWLAAEIGISVQHLSNMMNGRKRFTPEMRRAIAAALEVTEEMIFGSCDGHNDV